MRWSLASRRAWLITNQQHGCSLPYSIAAMLIPVLTLSAHDSAQATTVTMSEYDVDGLGRVFERGGIDVIKGKWHVMEGLADPRIHCSF
jgi:hypothetical protein